MKIPSYRRLNKVDYEEKDQPLIERLSYTVNIGFETLYQALSNRLTFGDNFNGIIRTLKVSTDSNAALKGNNSISTSGITTQVNGTIVLNLNNLTNPNVYPTVAPFISFTQGSGNISINNITGLVASTNYSLTVLVLGS